MNIGLITQAEKKTTIFSPLQPVVATPPPSDQGRKTNKSTRSWACCGGFNDCMVGSTISRPQKSGGKMDQQLAEMEKELQRQKELKAMYKTRLERVQNYLRHCPQIAQENGFLDLMIDNKVKRQESPLASDVSPASVGHYRPPQMENHSNLALLYDQAKMNGWCIEPYEIELEESVVQGSTADVFRGRWRGLDVAVKCIFPNFFQLNEDGISFFVQEVETLSRQRHPFVLHLMGACLDPPNHGWIVTEFLCMTLKDWLHGPGKRRKERTIPIPPMKDRLAKALEIAQAMQYLHEQKPKVIHRDLKPSNIFLDESMHVRVADFGHARFLSDGEKALTGETGTYVYMAPEVLLCLPYDDKCDVYSFAIILNELITCQYPYFEIDFGPSKIALEVAASRLRPTLPKLEGELEELVELIQQSWHEDPAARPSFATITCRLRTIIMRHIETP